MMQRFVDRTIVLASLALLAVACGDSGETDSGPSACVSGQFCVGNLVCVAGLCVEPGGTESPGDGDSGDGDSGDGDTGDGDGDGDTGDGDGDDDTGDGDGDGDSGDGDGDGDSGDGDGDIPSECGNGVVEGEEACDDGNGVDADVCSNDCEWGPLTKIVFATSETYTADFGGIVGADAACQSLADAAGLPGNYLAWLSTEFISPSTRFTKSAKPYVLVNGKKVADDWADLTDESLDNPIDTDEWGDPSPESTAIDCIGVTRVVFTATQASGEQGAGQCCSCLSWGSSESGYNVSVGRTTLSNTGWTQGCSGPYCEGLAGLYCFQQ